MFMNSKEDRRRIEGLGLGFLKLWKIQGLDPGLLAFLNTNTGVP
jgi:hypothetical protein